MAAAIKDDIYPPKIEDKNSHSKPLCKTKSMPTAALPVIHSIEDKDLNNVENINHNNSQENVNKKEEGDQDQEVNKNEEQEPTNKKVDKVVYPINISRCKRFLMFLWITAVNLLVNMDHGTIPAVTNEIEKDLKIDTSELGLFGSLVYFGNLLGAMISMAIINKINRKILIIIFLGLNGAGLFAFTATQNIGFLYFDRVMVGSFQAFITIYCPVWVDQFGSRTLKAVMMAVVQIASPVGVVVGYTLTTTIKEENKWTFSYIVQAILFALFAISAIFIPVNYLSTTLHCINPPDHDKIKLKFKEKEIEVQNNNGVVDKEMIPNQEKEPDVVSLFDHIKEEDNKAKYFWKTLCVLIKVKLFMLCVSSLSCLMFISTAIQYWTTNYLTNDLKFDSTVIFVAFVVTSLSAPTAGILLGGCVVQKFGGYETKHALLICTLFGIGAVISGSPIPFVDSVPAFTSTLWLFLFFGGCVVPNVFGIIISSVPDDMKAAANSATNFLINVFGFIPAPYVYGLIYESTKIHEEDKQEKGQHYPNHFAYGFIIYYSFISVLFVAIATCVRYKQFNEKLKSAKEAADLTKDLEDSKNKYASANQNSISKIQHNIEDVSNIKIALVECEKDMEVKINFKKCKTHLAQNKKYLFQEGSSFENSSPIKKLSANAASEKVEMMSERLMKNNFERIEDQNHAKSHKESHVGVSVVGEIKYAKVKNEQFDRQITIPRENSTKCIRKATLENKIYNEISSQNDNRSDV